MAESGNFVHAIGFLTVLILCIRAKRIPLVSQEIYSSSDSLMKPVQTDFRRKRDTSSDIASWTGLKLTTCCTYKPSSLALGSLGYLLWSSGLLDT
jgi:hypothetical protein